MPIVNVVLLRTFHPQAQVWQAPKEQLMPIGIKIRARSCNPDETPPVHLQKRTDSLVYQLLFIAVQLGQSLLPGA